MTDAATPTNARLDQLQRENRALREYSKSMETALRVIRTWARVLGYEMNPDHVVALVDRTLSPSKARSAAQEKQR
jgi:hypothetical protein